MSRFLIVLLILLLVLGGYFYLYPNRLALLNPVNQTASNEKSTQPLEENKTTGVATSPAVSENSSSDSLITLTPEEKKVAQAQLNKMISTTSDVLDARQVNQFVTGDQLLQLPQTADASTKIQLNQPKSNEQTNQATSFGVTLAPFNPKATSDADTTNGQIINLNQPSIGTKIQLKELLNSPDSQNGKRIFYIHAVNNNDEQGIWGILQSGLTDTFAKGMALTDQNTLITADIPKEADEVLANKQSSFLGKLLHNKVETTYIYNYEQGLLGQNPNLIKPGQQLIIVTFTEDELLQVYQHFTQQGNQ